MEITLHPQELKMSTITVHNYLARESGRALQLLSNQERSLIVKHIAQLLLDKKKEIMEANDLDVKTAQESGTAIPMNF